MLHKSMTSLFQLKAEPKHPEQASAQGASLEVPTSAWTVKEIKAWLDANGISYDSSDLKADLLQKVGVADV